MPAAVTGAVADAYAAPRRGGARRGALVGHRGGPPVRQLRGPAGHLPQRRRRRGRARRRPPLLGVAVDRPRGRLPRHQRHRPPHRASRRGRPADGRRRGRGRALHRRPGHRPAPAGGDRREPGPRRGRGLRRRQPGPLRRRHRDRVHSRPAARRQADRRPLRCPAGVSSTSPPSDATADACLTDDQVRALAALGDRVEAHYGAPQDTEWAIDTAGTLWLTQARPITTLYPMPLPRPRTDLRVYFCFSVAQGLYRPITPMGLRCHPAARRVRVPGVRIPGRRPARRSRRARRGRPAAVHRSHPRHPQPGRPIPHAPRPRRHGGPVRGGDAAAVRRPAAVDHPAVATAVRPPRRAPRHQDRTPRTRRSAPSPIRTPCTATWTRCPTRIRRRAVPARHRHARGTSRPRRERAGHRRLPPGTPGHGTRRGRLRDAGPGRQARRAPAPASSRRCCAACRTTSPPPWTSSLWHLATHHPRGRARDRPAAVPTPAVLAARWRDGSLPASVQPG